MESINDLFGNYSVPVKGKRLNENGELLRYFCDRLNPGRIETGYPPLDIGGMKAILKYMMRKRDLYWLKSVCEDSEKKGYSFSKKFWYIAKQQKSVENLEGVDN